MNNKSGSELTHPHGACDECAFPYSYDPTDGGTVCVRCLKEKRDHLQKLCEEQKGERESLIKHEKALSDAYMRIRLLVDAFDTNYGGENRFEVTENKIKDLKSQLAEQRGELESLRKVSSTQSMFINAYTKERDEQTEYINTLEKSFKWDAYKSVVNENIALKSQLATQTERIGVLEAALRPFTANYISEQEMEMLCEKAEQALKQERLGDGGKDDNGR